ncbi:MAG: FHA domain-containing protein [Anaerolineae bacterium]|nr:FHA domain-containing protein [Anaerolineae bacterium]
MTDVPQPPLQAEWQVILNDGSNGVKIVPVPPSGLLIGRAPTADLHLDDPRVSRHHARLTWQGDQLFVEDLQTVNGTMLNGQPLNQAAAVRPNDLIGLGPYTLRVEQSLVPVTPPPQEIHAYPQPEQSFVPVTLPDEVTSPPEEIRTYPQPEPSPVPVTPPAQETRAYPQSRWPIWGLLLAAGLAGFIITGLFCWGLYRYWFAGQETPAVTLTGPTLTISQAPANNSAVPLHEPITVQVLASDATGVTRLELWANGRKVDEVDTQLVEVAPTLNAALQWRTSQPGPLTLEVRAYNSAGQVSAQTISNLRVAGQSNTPAVSEPAAVATPNPTAAPLLPTATPIPAPAATFTPNPTLSPGPTPVPATSTSPGALLTLNVPALNVRSGPGTQYSLIGQLTQSAPAEIIGQASAEQGQWWQIRFANGPGGAGWVTADPAFVTTSNTAAVPVVSVPTPQLPEVTVQPTNTPLPAPTATAPREQVIRAPAGKTLLIASNRSMANHPALLTLEGESVGGGDRVEVPADGEVQLVLEPDFYRATWSSPGPRGGFASGADFTAVADKIMVMWVVPEEDRSAIETYDELTVAIPTPTPTPTPAGTATPGPITGSYPAAPAGKALFVAANGTLENNYAVLTLSGGGLSGGQEIKLDAGAEISVELLPGGYRAVWTSPAGQRAFSTGREFQVSEGEVILSWIVPEQRQVFMQFPGQDPQQINK